MLGQLFGMSWALPVQACQTGCKRLEGCSIRCLCLDKQFVAGHQRERKLAWRSLTVLCAVIRSRLHDTSYLLASVALHVALLTFSYHTIATCSTLDAHVVPALSSFLHWNSRIMVLLVAVKVSVVVKLFVVGSLLNIEMLVYERSPSHRVSLLVCKGMAKPPEAKCSYQQRLFL